MIREFIQRQFGRIFEFYTTATNVASRTIRTAYTSIRRSLFRAPSHDWTRPDYAFWKRAVYGRARGLEMAGLFIKPIVSKIAAWTLGQAPRWSCESERSQEALDDWWADHHADVLRGWRAALKQGDAFAVINADMSITLVPPDLVDPIVSEDDYSEIVGWRVTQTIMHPERTSDRLTITDEYTAERRLHRVERNGRATEETEYPNLIGRLPIVHIANQVEDGATFGHPEAEALVELMHRYNEVLEAAIEGNVLQGRPTPVLAFQDTASLDKFWSDYGESDTTELPDGTTETVTRLGVDLQQLLTVAGATFDYKSPGSFSSDTTALLQLLYYLIIEHTELPEFVLGSAVASSKASTETQMPVFIRYIEMRRGEMARWLTEIAEVVLAYLSLMEPGVVAESPQIQWEELDQADGQLTLTTLQWALTEGLIDDRTALMLAPVRFEDIDALLEAAEAQREERAAQFQGGQDEQASAFAFQSELDRLEAAA